MKKMLSKRMMLQKIFQVGGNTLVSRIFGLVRERLLMQFLGISIVADAFNVAFLIPNSLRKIFAEGALTAAFVPTFVSVFKKDGTQEADGLMTLTLIWFEGIILALCLFVMWQPAFILSFFAPGFSAEQTASAISCLRILMPFIFFISASSLLGGALQSVHHFFVPSFASVVLNVFFIGGTLICLYQGYAIDFLCWAIIVGGCAQFLMHLWMYFFLGFGFSWPVKETYASFVQVFKKFIPCAFSMGIVEVNLIIDNIFASYQHVGTVTLIKLTTRLMGIPLGVFSTAFSTISLPHFARVATYAPRRLSFYFLESAKLVLWVTAPATLIMCYLADDIFLTLIASGSSKFPSSSIAEAGWMLTGFLLGLFWISINKILLSVFYSFHDTVRPTVTAAIATVLNAGMNFLFVRWWGGVGIPFATTLSGVIQVLISLYLLHKYHNFALYFRKFGYFVVRYLGQVLFFAIPAFWLYKLVRMVVEHFCTSQMIYFLMLKNFGYWIWATPLILMYFYVLYRTRRFFKVKVYFLD